MARLIDADDLIKEINKKMPQGSARGVFKAFIDEQPTAYNVEKVVAELEKSRMIFFLTIANKRNDELDFAYKNVCTALDKAIDIVKAGGVDD